MRPSINSMADSSPTIRTSTLLICQIACSFGLAKRKRHGVYYTPEWVVQRIVDEVMDPLFAHWKQEAGWPEPGDPSREAALAYWERLTHIKVIVTACGSGAFLIVALRHLEKEFAAAAEVAVRTSALERMPDEAA